jgi:hypothetical protein
MQVTPLCSLQNPLQFRGHNKDHKANQPLIAQLLLSFSYVIVFRIRKSYLCGQKKGVKPLHDTASAKDYFSALKKKGAGSPGKSSPNTHWPPAKKTPIKPLMKSLKKPPYKGRRVHRRGGIIHRFNTPTHTHYPPHSPHIIHTSRAVRSEKSGAAIASAPIVLQQIIPQFRNTAFQRCGYYFKLFRRSTCALTFTRIDYLTQPGMAESSLSLYALFARHCLPKG